MKIVRLMTQLALSFTAIALLTALAVGLPAIWIVGSQAERQSEMLLAQGRSATQALLETQQSDLDNLALLTAQRPTLRQLVQTGSLADLEAYLQVLQTGANLDFVLLCTPDAQLWAAVGEPPSENICPFLDIANPHDYWAEPASAGAQSERAWAFSGRAFFAGGNASGASPTGDILLGQVVVGERLDQAQVVELAQQTGLQLAWRYRGQTLAASHTSLFDFLRTRQGAEQTTRPADWQHSGYRFDQITTNQEELDLVLAQPLDELAQAQAQLTNSLLLAVLGAALVSSLAGALLAGWIGRPLARLEQAASAMRAGQLDQPVVVGSSVREVARVAYALEDARQALRHSLHALRKEKEWIEHLLDAIVEGIVTLDPQGRITFFSPGAAQILGWPAAQVLGRDCDEIFRLPEAAGAFRQALPAPGQRQRLTVLSQSGRWLTLSISGARLTPPEAGNLANRALVLRDVSNEEATHRLLGDFLANITHEFRTPLAALAASTELLLDQLPDLTQAELLELVGSVRLGILSLQTLIDNLLEGASIESGRFRVTPHPVELADVLAEAVQTMQPLMQKYHQQLHIEPADQPALLVLADGRRTGQVLVNLLANAVRHNPPQGQIILRVQALPAGGEVRVEVADEGPGVASELLPNIFGRFVRSEAAGSERVSSGAGLGLSVVKAIVEAQGGQVGVENRLSGGAVFWFTLRRAESAASLELPASGQAESVL